MAYQRRRSFRGREGEHDEAWLFGIAYRQLARYRRGGEIERRALRRLGLERPVLGDDELERVLELGVLDGLRGRLDGALDALPASTQRPSGCGWSTSCPTTSSPAAWASATPTRAPA